MRRARLILLQWLGRRAGNDAPPSGQLASGTRSGFDIQTRYRAKSLDRLEARRARRLYEAGDSIADIATALDLAQYVVGKELRRAGVPIRPRGFQPKK